MAVGVHKLYDHDFFFLVVRWLYFVLSIVGSSDEEVGCRESVVEEL